eukprot:SAG31_NODE_913_length_11064_cov_4.529594_4_plen_71_part_00
MIYLQVLNLVAISSNIATNMGGGGGGQLELLRPLMSLQNDSKAVASPRKEVSHSFVFFFIIIELIESVSN